MGTNAVVKRMHAPNRIDVVLSILVMFNFAFAHPLLDLLGRNAEFFLAHDATRLDIFFLALVLTLLAPLALAGVVLVLMRVNRGLGVCLHALVFAALASALALQVLKNLFPSLPAGGSIASALAIGAAATIALYVSRAGRSLVRMGAPLPLLVAGLFLFASPAAKLIFPPRLALAADADIPDPAPVVMVVFDELPVASLMNERGHVDARLFPNFARLASDSTWFRNATSVHGFSPQAVPAVLTGQYPNEDDLPVIGDHPNNLFTLLAGRYDIRAIEPLTRLCPPQACGRNDPGRDSLSTWEGLLSDAAVVSAHMLLPEELASGLPPIDRAWAGFADLPGQGRRRRDTVYRDLAYNTDRPGAFSQFVASVRPRPKPPLYFLHSLLPHDPWEYFPSGQQYRAIPPFPAGAPFRDRWGRDAWLVGQAYQRHLLQVAYVDRLLGDLLKRLERARLYDRALVVITADHGVAFQPGRLIRAPTRQNFGEVAAVPLFVKRPFQTKGIVVDRPVESVDVLPTIADVLGMGELRFAVDGRSAFDVRKPERKAKVVFSGRRLLMDPRGREKYRVVERKYRIFGKDGLSVDLFELGPSSTGHLVGRALTSLAVTPVTSASVAIQEQGAFRNVDPGAAMLPNLLQGRLTLAASSVEPAILAIALNGEVAAVTRTYARRGPGPNFYAMLPPGALRPGRNRIEAFLVERNAGRLVLRRPESRAS